MPFLNQPVLEAESPCVGDAEEIAKASEMEIEAFHQKVLLFNHLALSGISRRLVWSILFFDGSKMIDV